METCQALSVESFSYRWLVEISENSIKASVEAFEEASFIEMDPNMPPSKRFSPISQEFNFQFSLSPSSLSTVHADQLFSNGYLIPRTPFGSSNLAQNVTILDSNHNSGFSDLRKRRRWRFPSLIVHKYLSFFRPLCQRFRQKSSSKVGKFDRKSQSMKKLVVSSSPRISVAYSADDWRMSCDSDSSIYEAVLHCKNSFGK